MFTKEILTTLVVTIALVIIGSIPAITYADTNTNTIQDTATSTFRWNNENWFTLPHPEPATFAITETGEAYGTTTTNIPFMQINIENDAGIRVQKFIIQDHYHFIVNGIIVYEDSDLQTLLATY